MKAILNDLAHNVAFAVQAAMEGHINGSNVVDDARESVLGYIIDNERLNRGCFAIERVLSEDDRFAVIDFIARALIAQQEFDCEASSCFDVPDPAPRLEESRLLARRRLLDRVGQMPPLP